MVGTKSTIVFVPASLPSLKSRGICGNISMDIFLLGQLQKAGNRFGHSRAKRQKDLERLRSFRPMDDDFMRCLFKDNIPLAELVLRIITGKPDLVITDCQTQKDMKRLGRVRSAWMHTVQILPGRNMTWKSSHEFQTAGRPHQIFEGKSERSERNVQSD